MNQIFWQPGMKLDQLEKAVILKCLQFYGNNKTATAESLGIAIRTIDYKLERYRKEQEEEAKESERIRAEQIAWAYKSIGKTPPVSGNEGAAEADGCESASEVEPQPEMPMPERDEVQSMLPIQTTKLGNRRARG